MTADEHAAEVDALSRRYPGWTIWFGPSTGRWWALPPRERDVGGFVEAETPQRLIARIEVIRHARSGPPDAPAAQQTGPETGHGSLTSENSRSETRRPSNLLRLEGGTPSPFHRVPAVAWPGGTAW
ncbi:MAG: hypothetical protein IRY90_09470 [Actinomadura rubrobrunea]|nr:hypothetical protein [Actinomadura rubrobrunea]